MLGYHNFFIWVLISALPVLFLCRFLNIKDQEPNATDNSNAQNKEVGAEI